MNSCNIIGIDLSKKYLQVHEMTEKGQIILKKKFTVEKFREFIGNHIPAKVAMEACSTSHYWGKVIKAAGHEVKLLPAQHVKPFVKRNKDDAADAEAIAEASLRPNIHSVPIKSDQHLDLQAIIGIRARLTMNKTQILNSTRALLLEKGIFVPIGTAKIKSEAMRLIHATCDELTPIAKTTVADLMAELLDLEERLQVITKRINSITKENSDAQKLKEIDGVGDITAAAIIGSIPNMKEFKNGRQFAAFIGLTPKHTGTGGKTINLGISKRGNTFLRSLLVQGSSALLQAASIRERSGKPPKNNLTAWAIKLMKNKKRQQATVALANKIARIIWAVLAKEVNYNAGIAAFKTAA